MSLLPKPDGSGRTIPPQLHAPLRNGAMAGVLVVIISLFLQDSYRCEAQILPDHPRAGAGLGGQMAAMVAAAGIALPDQANSDLTFTDILNSRWMQKSLLLETYRFSTRAWFFGRERERRETLYAYFHARNLDQACRMVRDHLTVAHDLKSKLLTISAETPSAALSQQMVRRAVAGLEEFIEMKSRSRGGNKAAFTAERVQEASAASALAAREAEAFLRAHRNYATSNDPAVRLEGVRLEGLCRLRQQVVATLTLNYEQALLEKKNDMPVLNILDEGDLPQEKSGPFRSRLALLAFLLAGGGTWLWRYIRGPGRGLPPAPAERT